LVGRRRAHPEFRRLAAGDRAHALGGASALAAGDAATVRAERRGLALAV
jgi:hypothetical protein